MKAKGCIGRRLKASIHTIVIVAHPLSGRASSPIRRQTNDVDHSAAPSGRPHPSRARVARMNFQNRNFVRGLVLMAIAVLFGLVAYLHYPIGHFSRGGPGLFPFMISCILFVIGALTVVRSHFVPPAPMNHSVKNIALVLTGLAGFALISEHLDMIPGIVFLVFVATAAGTSYSVVRNVKISVGLIAVAYAFKYVLGLNLPLLGQ